MEEGERDLGRVLVTGAQGFVGAALTRRLRAAGQDVTGTDLRSASEPCDLTDYAQVDAVIRGGYQTIFHCGAVSGPMVLADQPLAIWRINALGTAHVLEAARVHGTARVVVCSTSEVYGTGLRWVDEVSPPDPPSVYGASKLAAEAATLAYVREHGLDAVTVRLSWIYGPGRLTATNLETVLRAVIAGQEAVFDASPEHITHYLYIDDAVSGVIAAGRAAVLQDRLYNISAGDGVTVGSLAEILRGLHPQGRIRFGGAGLPCGGPLAISNRRAAVQLGFEPAVSAGVGLDRYLRALRG